MKQIPTIRWLDILLWLYIPYGLVIGLLFLLPGGGGGDSEAGFLFLVTAGICLAATISRISGKRAKNEAAQVADSKRWMLAEQSGTSLPTPTLADGAANRALHQSHAESDAEWEKERRSYVPRPWSS